jgi:hypothetical protein
MKARLPEAFHAKIDAILQRATNVLSVIHPHIYFPVYSNGLKDIGRFLAFKRAHESATGPQTIVWRKHWSKTKAPDIKAQILQYNQDDGRALKHVVESIGSLISSDVPTPPGHEQRSVINTTHLRQARSGSHNFQKIEFAVPDLDVVNRAAYFDYQRQKIFVRASTSLKRILRKALPRRSRLKPNKVIQLEAKKCVSCSEQEDFSVVSSQENGDRSEVFQGRCKKVSHRVSIVEVQMPKMRHSLCPGGCSRRKSNKIWTRACNLVHIQQLGLWAEPA